MLRRKAQETHRLVLPSPGKVWEFQAVGILKAKGRVGLKAGRLGKNLCKEE